MAKNLKCKLNQCGKNKEIKCMTLLCSSWDFITCLLSCLLSFHFLIIAVVTFVRHQYKVKGNIPSILDRTVKLRRGGKL